MRGGARFVIQLSTVRHCSVDSVTITVTEKNDAIRIILGLT